MSVCVRVFACDAGEGSNRRSGRVGKSSGGSVSVWICAVMAQRCVFSAVDFVCVRFGVQVMSRRSVWMWTGVSVPRKEKRRRRKRKREARDDEDVRERLERQEDTFV